MSNNTLYKISSLSRKVDCYLRLYGVPDNVDEVYVMSANVLSFLAYVTCTSENNPFNKFIEVFKKLIEHDLGILTRRRTGRELDIDTRIYEGWEGATGIPDLTARPQLDNASEKFNALEWDQIKQYIVKWKSVLEEIKNYCASWPTPEKYFNTLDKILTDNMHIKEQSPLYNEILTLFIEIVDRTGTLGVGIEPRKLKTTTIVLPTARNTPTAAIGNILEKERNGFLNKWYAWAAQWWLPRKHEKWFEEIHRMSHSDDIDYIHRLTRVVLIDDASTGYQSFVQDGIQPLNMPSLKYVNIFVNKDPWWRPPKENTPVKIAALCKVSATPIYSQDERTRVMKGYIDTLKEKKAYEDDEGNVVLYSTSCDLIGYCLYKDVAVYIENPWAPCISIKSLRDQVMAQRNLLGPATRYVKEETRILTFMALMLLSVSHGIPMYVSIGWQRTLTEWYAVVSEDKRRVKPEEADDECTWLARKRDDVIVLNQPVFTVMFVRLLSKAFTPDKKVVAGDGGDGYMKYLKKHYTEMKEENRIGSGKVKPVVVLSTWSQENTLEKVIINDEFSKLKEKKTKAETMLKKSIAKYKKNEEQNIDFDDEEELKSFFDTEYENIDDLQKAIDDIIGLTMDDVITAQNVKGEWMYAQRLMFINNYYAPTDLETLLRTFGIRFEDWTASEVTINL